jgi:CBS domain-containing protein
MVCPSCGFRNLEGADECSHCGAALTHVDLPAGDAASQAALMKRPLSSLGLTQPVTIESRQSLEQALRLMAQQHLDLLNIVENGCLVGVLSVRDVLTRVGVNYQAKLGEPVSSFMTPAPVTLPPDAPIPFALNKMDVGGYRHIPVVEQQRLQGLVTAHDLLRQFVSKGKS